MPRRGYSNSLEAPIVQYIPGFNEDIAKTQLGQLTDINKKWDETEQAVANAIAEYGALPVRDTEAPLVQQRIIDFNKYVQDAVGKYGGRYDLAAGDIARKMANEAQFYSKAQQAYEKQKQYEPLYAKYAQNLLFRGQDPRKQAIFDEQGNYVGMPDFTPYERSQYDQLINEGVVKGIDKISKDTGLSKSKIFGYLEQAKLHGLAALPEGDLKERVKSFLPQFMAQSTFSFDPNMQGINPEQFVLGRAASLAGSGIDKQYDADWLARTNYQQKLEAAEYNRRKAAERASTLTDIETMGPRAQDIVENTFLDQAGSVSKALDIPGYPLDKNNLKDIKSKLTASIEKDKKAFEDKASDPVVKARVIGPRLELAKQNLKRIESVEPILEKNRELYKRKYGKYATDYELAKFIDNDSEALQREYTYTRPVLNPLTSKMLKTTVKEMSNAKFRIGDEDVVGTSLSDVANRLGTEETILKAALDSEDYSPRYNIVSGEYYINIPTDAKITDAGKVVVNPKSKYKRLYFTPDELSSEYSIALKTLKNEISKGSDKPLEIKPTGDVLNYVYNPSYGGEKADKKTPRIDVYDRSTGKRLTNADGIPVVFSITDMEDHVEELNSKQQKKRYTIPWM